MKSDLLQTLQARGFIQQATNLEGLDNLCAERKIIGYIGFDLTADSLHVGSLMQIMVLRWMAKFGHRPLVLLGRATTKIGDPSGKSATRPMLDAQSILHNEAGIAAVLTRLLGDDNFVDNESWFEEMNFFDYLRDYGPHFTINRMLTFDSVKSRLERQDPLTFLEFNYMLMQAIDFLKLYQIMECRLQIGGSDQWGNIVNGVELVRRIEKAEVFGLTTPLMTNTAGEKMGKTANGAIWLDPDKTSAFQFYQFWRNVEDGKVGEFLRLFTEVDLNEIERMEMIGGAEINAAKTLLATEVTALIHGRATAEDAARLSAGETLGRGGAAMLVHVITAREIEAGINIAQILTTASLVSSKTEATKLTQQGGVKINGRTVVDARAALKLEDFDGDSFLLTVGKHRAVVVKVNHDV